MFFHPSVISLLAKMKQILRSAGQKGWILLPVITSLISFAPGMVPGIALEFPPTKKGAPARTSGGGVRDPKDILTVLLPDSGIHSFVGDRVTLFVNVPNGVSQSGFLVIFNDDETLFEQTLELPNSSGLMGITLPKSVADSLALNQVYDWEFAILPDGVIQQEEQVAIGQVQRLEIGMGDCPNVEDTLAVAEHFSELSLWQETLMAIAPLNQTYASEWQSLLTSVKLDSLAEIPWVGFVALEDT